ncbi:MAG: hypothetical protein LBV60_14475 [Streptomyces sp.]|jgi:hypothetical protein|nr:hypothetical protein [Streptomyces sp.]
MPDRVHDHRIAAAVWIVCAALVAWWSIGVHHTPALTFAVNGLAVLGAADLAICIRNIVCNFWRQRRRSHRERG